MTKMEDIQQTTSIKPKVYSLKSFENVEKPQARLMKKKERRIITNYRNEKKSIIIDLTDIAKIIQKYYKKVCINKFDSL